MRAALIWGGLALVLVWPLWVAMVSPLLQWREPVYVAAGLAGIVALGLMLVQPLLAAGLLPGLGLRPGRRVHAVLGAGLVLAVAVHVAGLWITSPPDVIDALLFTSPTPFAPWGVVAMWALFAAACLAALRRRMRPRVWRMGHMSLVSVAVIGTVVHAILIEGTMGFASKLVLCALVVLVSVRVMSALGLWRLLIRRRA